jgi:hypothetical protein
MKIILGSRSQQNGLLVAWQVSTNENGLSPHGGVSASQ